MLIYGLNLLFAIKSNEVQIVNCLMYFTVTVLYLLYIGFAHATEKNIRKSLKIITKLYE